MTHTTAPAQPVTVTELEVGQNLYATLIQATTHRACDDPTAALSALEQLGRLCVAVLTQPNDNVMAQLARTLAPITAPVVARWAGADPEDDTALRELNDDLMSLRELTAEVREQLALVLHQTNSHITTAAPPAYPIVA